ncbi:ubiquitin domain-containing protein 7SL RNA1-like [Syzygium oleosum]|uniref:ubiquitin domain-containing protein 7SL RNA1-like n=1 Tax=Syzygium oleosum TaxID=219896 RepID=UPI0024B9928F|nr:ubiquitin domain-containing protein 7SL RNA1-like [Syzygium oleosum]
MDVFFEPQEGSPFYIQIGFHDTVLEIKEKIEKHQGISVCRHTLVFNDEALDDELDVEGYNIHDRSCIRLVVAPEQPPSTKIELRIGTPPSRMRLPTEVKVNDPVKRLREVVRSLEDVPLERVKLYANGTELEDDHRICDYQLQDNSSVDVRIKPLKFTVMVLPWKANLKVAVEVEQWEKIKVLRKELEKLRPSLKFDLSSEGYFFIHNQSGMDEDRSFKWHGVEMGDTIEGDDFTMRPGFRIQLAVSLGDLWHDDNEVLSACTQV